MIIESCNHLRIHITIKFDNSQHIQNQWLNKTSLRHHNGQFQVEPLAGTWIFGREWVVEPSYNQTKVCHTLTKSRS